MIHRIMTWCAGYVLVRLPGAQAERFVNICRAKGIVWWGLRWQQDQRMVYGYLRRSDYYKLRPIAAKTGVFPLVREGSAAISGCEEEWRGQASGAVFCAFWESCFSCPDGSGGSRCPVSPTTRGRVSLNIWSRRMSTEECPAAGFPAGSLRQSFERNIRMLAGYR